MFSIIKISSILLIGLSAGFFYAWAVSVIPGHKRVSDKSYIESMQQINRAIINPAFFMIFFGPLILLFAQAFLSIIYYNGEILDTTIISILFYLVGTIGITVIGNVPMNNELDKLDLGLMDSMEIKESRHLYEKKWNRLHNIRTLFSILAFLSLLI